MKNYRELRDREQTYIILLLRNSSEECYVEVKNWLDNKKKKDHRSIYTFIESQIKLYNNLQTSDDNPKSKIYQEILDHRDYYPRFEPKLAEMIDNWLYNNSSNDILCNVLDYFEYFYFEKKNKNIVTIDDFKSVIENEIENYGRELDDANEMFEEIEKEEDND